MNASWSHLWANVVQEPFHVLSFLWLYLAASFQSSLYRILKGSCIFRMFKESLGDTDRSPRRTLWLLLSGWSLSSWISLDGPTSVSDGRQSSLYPQSSSMPVGDLKRH